MYIVLLGAPGAGKGTQATVLAQRLSLAHVASGDLFREHLRQGTALGQLAKSYMERGALVPDDVTVRMVLERLGQPDAERGAILDGFPRTVAQAEALDQALARGARSVDAAVLVDVSSAEIVRRLSARRVCSRCQTPHNLVEHPPQQAGLCDRCGGELVQRPDDRPETVSRRLEVYERETAPLVAYYARQGKLHQVNGEQPVEQVTEELLATVQQVA
ncbi:MAG: adenylate kinase [Chloroflexi bacterium]|nr:adenylate kinase [Chloroflexota bacterium]